MVITSDHLTRAFDRVAEACRIVTEREDATDIFVCVQGDEPLLAADTLSAGIEPFAWDVGVEGTMLTVPTTDESLSQSGYR